jgi:ketosteroid isomerase-like protein
VGRRLAIRTDAGEPDADGRKLPRRPGDSEFRAFKFDVLRVRDGAIAEITSFGPELFPAFDLPPTLGG